MKKQLKREKRITDIPLIRIRQALIRTRKDYNNEELCQLAESINQYGIIEPLAVRKISSEEYEIISGERRLRAAVIAGLKKVPCIVYDTDDTGAAVMSLVRNMHRLQPDSLETADAVNSFIRYFNITERECGTMLGVKPSGIYELVSMTHLSNEERHTVAVYGLTPGHIQAALRLSDPADRKMAFGELIESGMNVQQFENYIDAVISEKGRTRQRNQKNRYAIKNIRLFENTLSRATEALRMFGINVISGRSQMPGYIEYVVRIPTNASIQINENISA